MNIAERIFNAIDEMQTAEWEADKALTDAAGFDWESMNLPWNHSSYDSYDGSFEWELVDPNWKPTPEILVKWADLGFVRCWLYPKDGRHKKGEQYYELKLRKNEFQP